MSQFVICDRCKKTIDTTPYKVTVHAVLHPYSQHIADYVYDLCERCRDKFVTEFLVEK